MSDWERAIQLATRIVPLTIDVRGEQLRQGSGLLHRDVVDRLYEGTQFADEDARRKFVKFLRQCPEGGRDCEPNVRWPEDFDRNQAPQVVAEFDQSERNLTLARREVRSAANRYCKWLNARLTQLSSIDEGNAETTKRALEVLVNSTSILGSIADFDVVDSWIEDPGHGVT